jgi:hypothetical protein
MALIKARTRGKRLVRHRTRLDHETNETLYAYAHFLGESTEYVLNQVIDTVLAKDKDFAQWRASHSESFVPQPTGRERRKRAHAARPHAGSHQHAIDSGTVTVSHPEAVSSR